MAILLSALALVASLFALAGQRGLNRRIADLEADANGVLSLRAGGAGEE